MDGIKEANHHNGTAAAVASSSSSSSTGGVQAEQWQLWSAVATTSPLFVLGAAIALRAMEPRYRWTFYKKRTLHDEYEQEWDNWDDEGRVIALTERAPCYWPRDKARKTLAENWKKWEEERPEWFTAAWMWRVPDALLPKGVERPALETLAASLKRIVDSGNRRTEKVTPEGKN